VARLGMAGKQEHLEGTAFPSGVLRRSPAAEQDRLEANQHESKRRDVPGERPEPWGANGL